MKNSTFKTNALLLLIFMQTVLFAQNQTTGMASLLKNAPTAALQNMQQSQVQQQAQAPSAEKMTNQLAQQGICFTENKGQVADLTGKLRPDILFTAHGSGVKLFVTSDGIYYQFSRAFEKKKDVKNKMPTKFDMPEVDSTQFYRLDMKLIGANKPTQIIKEGEGSDYEDFYLAHCPNGLLGVKNYNRITFKNVYPNIDWVVYLTPSPSPQVERGVEYDFLVHPGADINAIKLKYGGAVNMKLDEDSSLKVSTPLGTVQEHAPLTLQNNSEIKSGFVVKDNTIGFDVKDWDGKSELRIDPSIVWATYYGGTDIDYGLSCAVDGSDNIYLAGGTASTTGITSGGFQNIFGGYYDAFLVKFSAAGARLWATYYGGIGQDIANSCAVDGSGNVYLAGETLSATGIASGGFQNTKAGSGDAFLVKFSPAGARLWATYYGGTGYDEGFSCVTDGSANVYLVGYTASTTGIASGGFQNAFGGGTYDAFLVKFSAAGARLWATYYGGGSTDYGYSCAVDGSGNIYLGGGFKFLLQRFC